MKTTLLSLVILALSSAANADIPPPAGTVITATITDTAASILYTTIGGPDKAFSSNIGEIKVTGIDGTERSFSKGAVLTSSNASSSTEIACVSYYDRGHHAICKLFEKFN